MDRKSLIGLLLIGIILIIGISLNVEATSGCCSWHGGVAYCNTCVGRYVCNDGTYSPTCTCTYLPETCGGGTTTTISTTTTTTSITSTTTTLPLCTSSPSQDLNPGDNAIDFQTPHSYPNNLNCNSNIYTCPRGYYAKVYVKYSTETSYDQFYIDEVHTWGYLGSGRSGDSNGFIWIDIPNTRRIRFGLISDGSITEWGVDVDIIRCSATNYTTATCNNCSDCMDKISSSPAQTIYLTTDITTASGDCIKFNGIEGVTFDCRGNNINGNSHNEGIYLNDSSDNIIKNCKVSNFFNGIEFYYSENNTLINNTANNNDYGIFLWYSNTSTLTGNTANNNSAYGIEVYYSHSNVITQNTLNNNAWHGIRLVGSNTNTLTGNTANNNLEYSGIAIVYSNTTTLTGNTANSNKYGIELYESYGDTINSNNVCSNTESDFYIDSSSGNSGDDNTCDTTYTWNDEGTTGCSHYCSYTTTTTTSSTSTTTTSTTTTTTPPSGNLITHFIDVGQGDAILLEKDSNYVLVDCGGSDTKISEYLTSIGVTSIDYLITTHPDADHIGGCDYVLENYDVTNVRDNGQSADTTTYYNYIALAHGKNYSVIYNGTLLDWNNVDIKILAPPGPYPTGDRNYNSIVARVSYGSVDFMLTGDCTEECENRLGGNIESEILKVGHHGSKYSTSRNFLENVNPEVAVISVGATNSYGHPNQEVLDRLADNGIETRRTDLEGTIIVTTGGSTYSVQSEISTTTTTLSKNCELGGDYPPCGEVVLAEVIDFINLWAEGKVGLSDVVDLISAWA